VRALPTSSVKAANATFGFGPHWIGKVSCAISVARGQ
jgi:hypothetical protein